MDTTWQTQTLIVCCHHFIRILSFHKFQSLEIRQCQYKLCFVIFKIEYKIFISLTMIKRFFLNWITTLSRITHTFRLSVVLCSWCFVILVGKVGSKNKEDAPYELESQFVLRLPSVSSYRYTVSILNCVLRASVLEPKGCFTRAKLISFAGICVHSEEDRSVQQHEHEGQTHHWAAP